MTSEEPCSSVTETDTFIPQTSKTRRSIPLLRYIVVSIGTAIASVGLSCNFAFNFAVVCRVNTSVDTKSIYDSNPHNSAVFHFPNAEMTLLYSGYTFGLFCVLVVCLTWKGYQKLSVRWTVFCVSFISSVITILIPVLYDWSPNTTLPIRFLQGAMNAPTIPLVGHITSKWAPSAEIGMFVSILTSYSQIGLFFLMGSAGVLCELFAWRGIFYFHGFAALIISLLFLVLYRDDPQFHSWIAEKELKTIIKAHSSSVKKAAAPLRAIFSNCSVWACLIACIGNYNGVTPFIAFATLIMKKALNLTDLQASHFNSLSFLAQLVLKLAGGKVTDCWSASETVKLRVFNTLSCGICGVLIMITAFIPSSYRYTCATLLAVFQGIIGFNSAGFNKAAVVVGRQHAHVILTCYGLILSLSTGVEPFIVGLVAPNSTWDEWFYLFISHGLILIITNAIFCVLIKGEAAAFTKDDTKQCIAENNEGDE